MGCVISCISPKGGCGKTTLAVNLAGALSDLGKTVILIDLDPRGSATRWSVNAPERGNQSGFSLKDDVYSVKIGGSFRAQQIKSEVGYFLDKTKSDIVIIDTPPGDQEDTLEVAKLSDLVLVPTTPSPLDLWMTNDAVNIARNARSKVGGFMPRISLVPCRLISGTILTRELTRALNDMGEPVAPGISQRMALVECVMAKQVISTFAANSPAHKEFKALAEHVVGRIQG